jgi:hypothetical protein
MLQDIHLSGFPTYTKARKRNKKDQNYHHYSTPTPLGESQATEGRTYDANESEALRAWVQKVYT